MERRSSFEIKQRLSPKSQPVHFIVERFLVLNVCLLVLPCTCTQCLNPHRRGYKFVLVLVSPQRWPEQGAKGRAEAIGKGICNVNSVGNQRSSSKGGLGFETSRAKVRLLSAPCPVLPSMSFRMRSLPIYTLICWLSLHPRQCVAITILLPVRSHTHYSLIFSRVCVYIAHLTCLFMYQW